MKDDPELSYLEKRRIQASKEVLKKELQSFYRFKKRKPISKSGYDKWTGRRFCGETIVRCFGTWEEACRQAEVTFLKKLEYSDKELIDHFRAVLKWREQRPVTNDFIEYNKEHNTTINPIAYSRRWGSFGRFVNLFLQYKRGQITIEQLVESKAKNNKREPITPALRAEVLRRDNYICRDCGASPRNDPNVILTVHHLVPVSKGGKTDLSNLVTNCNRCNLGKGDRIDSI
jgi:hypothetical protein